MRITTAITGLVLLIVLFTLIWVGQRRLVYFPFGDVPAPRDVMLETAEEVTFATADGLALNGWFVPAPRPPARFTMIVFNGNAGTRAYRAPPERISAAAPTWTSHAWRISANRWERPWRSPSRPSIHLPR